MVPGSRAAPAKHTQQKTLWRPSGAPVQLRVDYAKELVEEEAALRKCALVTRKKGPIHPDLFYAFATP